MSSCPYYARLGFWSRQCRSWSSAVAVLDKVLTCPLVCNVFASGARSWCASATDHGVYCGGDSTRARRGDRGVPSAQIMEFIVEVLQLVLVGVIVACQAPQIMEFIVVLISLVVDGVIVACQTPQIMEFIVVLISLVLDGVIVACQTPQIMEFIVEGAAGAVPAVVDVPVIMQRRDVRRHPCRGAERFSSCSTLTR